MIWNNVLAWSFQIGVLVAVSAAAAMALRLRIPGARLLFWHLALLGCLALPLVRPWKQAVISDDVSVSTMALVRPVETPSHRTIPLSEAALWLLAAGALARGGWLATGFWRLRQYRRHSRPLGSRDGVALLLSNGVAGPVTFGAIRPVVLLPAQFPEFEPQVQEAILCHELLHVRRRDWLFMVAEEMVRTVFWFHPAIWWLLGEIGLAREQEVDRQVVALTRSREEYVDALLAIAGARPQLDLAPAPLFLRKRHLKQRVVSILKEVRMSKTHLVSSMAAALGILAAACWLVTAAFPLAAAPQVVADAPGVTVEMGGATLMHRSPVDYPEAVRQKGLQGTVVVQVKTDGSGSVSDAQVLNGPEELRRAALQSVLNWHFTKDAAGSLRQVSITFQSGPIHVAPRPTEIRPPELASRVDAVQVLKSITIEGLSDQARADLLARLPVHEGDTLSRAQTAQVFQAVKEFDEHLTSAVRPQPNGNLALIIRPSDAASPAPAATPVEAAGTGRLRIGGNVQATKLISKATPVYPVEAKQARIQGTVSLLATIAKDGTIVNLVVISGHPLLVPSALEAVRQWVYQPTLLNGNPVEVETQIDVNYTLAQ
jgi:TonB family protein